MANNNTYTCINLYVNPYSFSLYHIPEILIIKFIFCKYVFIIDTLIKLFLRCSDIRNIGVLFVILHLERIFYFVHICHRS